MLVIQRQILQMCIRDSLETAVKAANKEGGHAQIALSYTLGDAYTCLLYPSMITKRNTDFNMQEKAVPAYGVITGYGVVNSNLVYIYSQDVTALNGSVGEMHAKKIDVYKRQG